MGQYLWSIIICVTDAWTDAFMDGQSYWQTHKRTDGWNCMCSSILPNHTRVTWKKELHLSYVLRGLLIIWVMCSVVYWSFELCAPWFTDHLSYVLRDLLIIWVMCSVVYWLFELCAPWFTDHLSYVLRGWLIIWVMCSVVYWSFARTRSVLNRIILRVLWIPFFLPILWKSQSLQRWERVMYWP
jgi:hypothetical protein